MDRIDRLITEAATKGLDRLLSAAPERPTRDRAERTSRRTDAHDLLVSAIVEADRKLYGIRSRRQDVEAEIGEEFARRLAQEGGDVAMAAKSTAWTWYYRRHDGVHVPEGAESAWGHETDYHREVLKGMGIDERASTVSRAPDPSLGFGV